MHSILDEYVLLVIAITEYEIMLIIGDILQGRQHDLEWLKPSRDWFKLAQTNCGGAHLETGSIFLHQSI